MPQREIVVAQQQRHHAALERLAHLHDRRGSETSTSATVREASPSSFIRRCRRCTLLAASRQGIGGADAQQHRQSEAVLGRRQNYSVLVDQREARPELCERNATGVRSVTPTTTRFGQKRATLASLTQSTVRRLARRSSSGSK